jgi:DNA polymerase-3 subunit alpha
LHVHSEYSFLDSACRVDALIAKAKACGQDSLALTDHGNMHGMIAFYKAAKKGNVKPIIGCEVYLAPESRHKRDLVRGSEETAYYHLILLCENYQGYENLMALATLGFTEGFYYKPRVDKELLRKHRAGLIALSACIRGEVPYLALAGQMEEAAKAAREYTDIFGKENFFLELQTHGLPDQVKANQALRELSGSLDIPLVVTNDVHYMEKSDKDSHDILLNIASKNVINSKDFRSYGAPEWYYKTPEEMYQLHAGDEEALAATAAIAGRCNVDIPLGIKALWMPQCDRPPEFKTDNEYLRHLAAAGLKRRYETVTREMNERLDVELAVLAKMGFSGYLLIVEDFISMARKMGVMVGPGRGSAAGSLVCYSIGITSIDPLRYNLLFERFLNQDRISMPDIDVDFEDRGRAQVIEYVVKKYGKDNVCQIGTMGCMKARAIVRDVARVLDVPLDQADRLAKAIPGDPKVTLESALKDSSQFKEMINNNPLFQRLLALARPLEGLCRQPGVHAAGVIIAPGEVWKRSPQFVAKDAEMRVSQYDGHWVEDVGLLKVDFLGLRNLTVITQALAHIKKNFGAEIDLYRLPLDDQKALQVFRDGRAVGIFQFESAGMRKYLMELQPTRVEDLIAMNALYRPGPMENIPSFIARKQGKEKINYYHDDLRQILEETYGVIVYQEQVMQIVQKMGGFSLAQADILRRAMGKKKVELMAEQEELFLTGALAHGYDRKLSVEIFKLLNKFAEYGFNKSHSAAYAIVAYQTAYLKGNFPAEFMAANLTSEREDLDRIVILIRECEDMGLKVVPPDINTSEVDFTVREGRITFGLAAIKNVGAGAIESISREREKNGPFRSLFEFCSRVDLAAVNRRTLEGLIHAGALDRLPGNRAQLIAALDRALDFGRTTQEEKANGQISLFEEGDPGKNQPAGMHEPALGNEPPLAYREMLNKEKEVLGFYLSGHPVQQYALELRSFTSINFSKDSLESFKGETEVIAGGMISALRTILTKKGEQMAFVTLEDLYGSCEVVVFSKPFTQYGSLLEADQAVLISGKFEGAESGKIIANKIIRLSESREKLTRSIHVRLQSGKHQPDELEKIKAHCTAKPGPCTLILHVRDAHGGLVKMLARTLKTGFLPEHLDEFQKIVGEENVWLGRNYNG